MSEIRRCKLDGNCKNEFNKEYGFPECLFLYEEDKPSSTEQALKMRGKGVCKRYKVEGGKK